MNAVLITIILLVVLTLSIWSAKKGDDWCTTWLEMTGILLSIISVMALFVHIGALCIASYSYGEFAAKRNAFEITLNDARATGNQMEAAAILRDVAQWNSELASRQYDNSTFVFEAYTDDRIDTLKPIK